MPWRQAAKQRRTETERVLMADADWVPQLFERIDAMDTEAFLSFLTDDASFRFGSAPPLDGKAAIREGVDGFFATIQALRHELVRSWVQGETVICQGQVTYTRKDGRELTLPFVNVFELAGGLIREYLIYIDINPLYA
jgi:ketosteroid isomerase-like protein